MKVIESPIIKQLVKETLNRSNKNEIDVSKEVAENLKKTRQGIFQNEIDYRFILNNFKPLKTNSRSAVDVLGFNGETFNFVEFKLFDENKPKSYHHWSALWHLRCDIEKLEHAATFDSNHNIEFYFVFAVRNSKKTLNKEQLQTATSHFYTTEKRKPSIKSFNQYTVLKTFESTDLGICDNWDTQLINRKGDSFLVGRLKKKSNK